MATYTRDHDHEKWMRHRLKEAVERFADGSAEKLGRLLGYTNGGFVREIIAGGKPVGKAIVARMEDVPGASGWFHAAPGHAGVADVIVKYRDGRRAASEPKAKRALSDRALNLAKRFDALNNPSHAQTLYAAMSALLDGFEAEQRQAPAAKPAAAPARRDRPKKPASGR
jgi:hypothetical protein